MRVPALCFSLIGILLAMAGCGGFTSRNSQLDCDEQRFRQEVSERGLFFAYGRLFADQAPERLDRLAECPVDDIALAAAFYRIRCTLLNSGQTDSSNESASAARVAVRQFVELAEARLGQPAPEWWKQALASAYLSSGYLRFRFPDPPESDARLSEVDKGYLLEMSGKQWKLPIEHYPIAPDNAASYFEGEKIDFLVLYLSSHSLANIVVAVDRDSGQALWSTRMTGSCGEPTSFGIGSNKCEIRADSQRAVVWGFSTYGVYLEWFDVQSGKSLGCLAGGMLDRDPAKELRIRNQLRGE